MRLSGVIGARQLLCQLAGAPPPGRQGPLRRVMEAYTGCISTRNFDALVVALSGDSGISKPELSRISQGHR